ncbi:IS3 family transposase [Paenibacillus cellulositrophicus]|uniref:IS3 family transposase n=1 Tax=Paenibacillus cellulositrophicus TaxID=562959 RepID=UPI0012674AA6
MKLITDSNGTVYLSNDTNVTPLQEVLKPDSWYYPIKVDTRKKPHTCIDSFFSHFKTEKLYLLQCKSEEELHQAVEDYIYFYNYQRFQAKLKQRAPIGFRHVLDCLVFFICLLDRGMIILWAFFILCG